MKRAFEDKWANCRKLTQRWFELRFQSAKSYLSVFMFKMVIL